jgi:homoserine kinase
MIKEINVFAPATVANVGPGFDVLGMTLSEVGDIVNFKLNDKNKLCLFDETGCNLPLDTEKNVTSVAIQYMLNELGSKQGIDITFKKKINPGSGIGSSAASCAAGAFGANELLGRPFSRNELVRFAMQGEKMSSGSAHADNVAPCLLGGFTIVQGYDPLKVVSIPYPKSLHCIILHPDIEIKTADSRRILRKEISLHKAVKQWGNVAGLVAGLMLSDMDLIRASLNDVIIEPVRSMLIPGFKEVKEAALTNDALGCSISGSGPSIFALTDSAEKAARIHAAMTDVYTRMGIPYDAFVSPINPEGTKLI